MPRPTHLTVSATTRSVLARDVRDGAESPLVGFEDAERTQEQVIGYLSGGFRIPTSVVESALWSSNLLNECGTWSHPDGLTFDDWVSSILSKYHLTFDKFWNRIEERETNVRKNRRS